MKISEMLDRHDLTFVLALALIGAGAWPLVRWAALILPGLVLLYVSLPTRPPFFERPPTSALSDKRNHSSA